MADLRKRRRDGETHHIEMLSRFGKAEELDTDALLLRQEDESFLDALVVALAAMQDVRLDATTMTEGVGATRAILLFLEVIEVVAVLPRWEVLHAKSEEPFARNLRNDGDTIPIGRNVRHNEVVEAIKW